MLVETLSGWLVEVLADRVPIQRVIERAIDVVVAQAEPELQHGVRQGLSGCFTLPVATVLQANPLEPIDQTLAAAVAVRSPNCGDGGW